MITFQNNLLYPIEHKVDYVKLEDNCEIWYKISSKTNQSRWHIAISLLQNGKIIQREDLSALYYTYGACIEYVKELPKIITGKEFKATLTDTLQDDLNELDMMLSKIHERIAYIANKYCGEKKNKINSEDSNKKFSS